MAKKKKQIDLLREFVTARRTVLRFLGIRGEEIAKVQDHTTTEWAVDDGVLYYSKELHPLVLHGDLIEGPAVTLAVVTTNNGHMELHLFSNSRRKVYDDLATIL